MQPTMTALPKKVCREILKDCARVLRADLTEKERAEALRIGRIQFASAGARREK